MKRRGAKQENSTFSPSSLLPDGKGVKEFADEFEPVEVKFAYPLKHKWMLTIELDEGTFSLLKKLAEGAGKEPGVLIRTWVLEHLKK